MPQTTDKRFSPALLRAARKQAGLSREHVAFATNLTVVTIGYWETGRVEPKANNLAAVAAVIGCSIEDLYEEVAA